MSYGFGTTHGSDANSDRIVWSAGGSAAFLGLSGNDRYLKLISTAVDEVTAEVAVG